MKDGEVVQIGTPVELFERSAAHLRRPFHRLAGHERAALRGRERRRRYSPAARSTAPMPPSIAAMARCWSSACGRNSSASHANGHPGRHRQGARCRALPHRRGARRRQHASSCWCAEGATVPQGSAYVRFDPAHTRIYARRLGGGVRPHGGKTVNQMGWLFVLPVVALVAFNAIIPLMTVVNYSVQETFGDNIFFWSGVQWFEQVLHSEPLPRRAAAADPLHRHRAGHRGPARPRHRARHAAPGTLGLGLPRADGAAAAHSLERGRRHVEHHGAARHRPARQGDQRPGHQLQLYAASRSRRGSPSS